MTNKVILLVEDNPDDEALTLRAFKKNNIMNEVVVARDGAEALDYLFGMNQYAGRDVRDWPSMVLLDLKLPKVSGLEVLKKIRTDGRTRAIPVVVLTSSKEEQDVAESYGLGRQQLRPEARGFFPISRGGEANRALLAAFE